MPEEACFCLQCMTPYTSEANCDESIPIKSKTSFLSRFKAISEKATVLSKRKKAAIIISSVLVLLLIPLSFFLLSPAQTVKKGSAFAAQDSVNEEIEDEDEPSSIAEAIFDEVFNSSDKEKTNNSSANLKSSDSASGSSKENVVSGSSTSPSSNPSNKVNNSFLNKIEHTLEAEDSTAHSESVSTGNSAVKPTLPGSIESEEEKPVTGTTNSSSGNTSSGSTGGTSANTNTGSSTSGNIVGNNNSAVTEGNSSGTTSEITTGNVTSEEISAPVLNYDDWEYDIDGDDIIIKAYTGNDKNIIIPSKFDGKYIYRILKGTFQNNSTLETVTFEDSDKSHSFWINSGAFDNCSSLTKISFPDNTNLGIYQEFAVNCCGLSTIDIDNNQYRFLDGALYYYSGSEWSLREYCEGYKADTYTVPAWCKSISSASTNISNNKYLKTVNIHANCYSMSSQFGNITYKYLENINVDAANPYYICENGILYDIRNNKLKLSVYPAGKKDKIYNIPENCTFDCYSLPRRLFTNVETITIPASSTISNGTIEDILDYFPNLKTIKMEKGHTQYSTCKNTLDRLVNVVEY